MTINTRMRLAALASTLALVIAAPAAIAQGSGTWYKGIHTDPPTNEGVSLSHSKQLMEQKIVAPAAVAQDSGTWYKDIHTDPVTSEGVSLIHTKALMEMRIAPSNPTGTQVEKSIELTDGSTVHVFADGKMAMEDKFGRAAYMEPGHAMQARDGKTIDMNGNEVARLDQIIVRNRIGG